MMRLTLHAVLSLAAPIGPAVARAQTPFTLAPCRIPGIEADVRCGTYWVFEDRVRRQGRKIPLNVIVLPSKSASPAPDPVWFVSPGGPGTTNSDLAVRLWSAWWRDRRDVVLVDLRGTGGASRLDCELPGSDAHPEGYLSTLFPAAAIRACRQHLGEHVDLRFYNTMLAVDDLDEIRAALGYAKVNLWGGSWGTRAVFVYLRRHPQAVRTATMEGVAPPSLKNPLPHARSAQAALDLLFDECDRQPACHAAFPNIRAEMHSVVQRLQQAPADVTVRLPTTGAPVAVRLTWQEFAEALRVMTYYLPNVRRVPLLVHRAYLGDLTPFADAAIASNRGLRSRLRFGFLLSVTCTEDVSRILPGEIARETDGTYLGDSRVREEMAACDGWPRGALPADYGDPVRSDTPVFLLSGTLDPVSPPHFAAEAARYLPHSLHVVAPGAHVPRGPCIDSMERAFLEAGSVAPVDTSCIGSMTLPSFVTADSISDSTRVKP